MHLFPSQLYHLGNIRILHCIVLRLVDIMKGEKEVIRVCNVYYEIRKYHAIAIFIVRFGIVFNFISTGHNRKDVTGCFFFGGTWKENGSNMYERRKLYKRKVYWNAVTSSRCDICENVATSARASNDFGDTWNFE